ncbi:MAG TPA: hypothetical protein VEL74_06670 [Thermoanaerobaculia bacterium]|nr:hypothetical protein [Thermoanaerobaculia bacterium]
MNELEQAAAEGIRVQREQRAALQAYSEAHGGELRRRDADMKVREEAACAAQAKALEAARARFGRPLFDRYLYEVVAPAMGRISQRSENRDWLRQQDTGCSAAKRFAAAQEGPSAADRQPGFEAKEPWEWTLYERLERRFDPQDMDRRLAEAEARAGRPAPEPGTTISIVNGRREPELLLPGEIFSRLLRLGFVLTSNPENRDTWRTGFAQGAEKLGLGEHFLDELEKVTAGAIRAHREEEAAHLEASKGTHSDRKRLEEEAEQRARAQCAAQATALEAARARFGRTLFDRYLYEVVALEMSSSSQGFQSEDMLRWHETGCP